MGIIQHPYFILNTNTAWDLLVKGEHINKMTLYVFLILTKNDTDMSEFLEIDINDINYHFSCNTNKTMKTLNELKKRGLIDFIQHDNKEQLSIRIFMLI